MPSYGVKVWVKKNKGNSSEYLPGLYVLENDGQSVIQEFLLNAKNDEWLTKFFETNRKEIIETLPKDCSCAEWICELKEQIKNTFSVIISNAKIGQQVGYSREKRSFVCFYSTRDNPKDRPTTQLIKYYSRPSSKKYISYIRVYGLQYGNDLVLITGICIKTTRTNQESEEIKRIEELSKKIANLIPNGYRFFNTTEKKIEDEI